MSKECAGCLNSIPHRDHLRCYNCQKWYDLDCANVLVKKFRHMSLEAREAWICEECRNKIPKGDNTNIPVHPTQRSAGRTGIPVRPSLQHPVTGSGKAKNLTIRSEASVSTDASANARPSTSSNFSHSSLSDHDTDDIDNEPITRKALKEIISEELGSSLRNLALEQRQLREVVDSFQQAISFFSSRYDELKTTLDDKSERIDKLEKENIFLLESLQNLTKRINISEQHARSSNIEIQCVPENKSENLVSTVLHLNDTIKSDVKDSDIVHCTRVAKKNPDSSRPRSILVRFNSPRQRDSFLAAATKYNRTHPRNHLNSRHLGSPAEDAQPIYVVEHLSAENKSLHAAARARARELDYRFVWVRNGRIFMKKNEDANRIFIDCAEKLDLLQ